MKMDRIMLKLSGEALAGDKKTGFSEETVREVAAQVKKVHDKGIQIGVVIGGGNFWRGRTSNDMDRVKADQIGMLATVTGHPYFSTDMGMVLYSIEIKADVILAAKAVDGVYDSDPNVNPDAKKIDSMTMQEIVDKQLKVIDLAAAVLAAENKMPMMLFGLNKEDSIIKTVSGEFTGTVVTVD